ncbi:hypothetical protein [Gemmata sp.]|uniref:hypothetical protein n=1 Tax=Gemmata sp. TaxID=1914242 RepID=UPI003F728B89
MSRCLSVLAFALAASAAAVLLPAPASVAGQKKKAPEWKAPELPGGKAVVTDTSDVFVKVPEGVKLAEGVTVAKVAPAIDFAYYPGQTYAGNPWSTWGESTFANGKYYASLGDHKAPAGTAFVYEYDPATKAFRQLIDLQKLLALPEGHYAPGKIHTTLTLGKDGAIYFGTHRGSTRVTTDQYHYKGDWIVRVDAKTGKAEVVAHAPVPKHCIPTGLLDPERLIFYGGTAPGEGKDEGDSVHFFAYDVQKKKVLCDVPDGPARAMIFAKSTGRVYYVQASGKSLMRYDPAKPDAPEKIPGEIGIRAASEETKDGTVYTVSTGQKGIPELFAFDTKAEKVTPLGPAAVGVVGYITALKIDPTGRYLYYVPGSHGGSEKDGSPVVQFDTKTKTRKVIAFLNPYYKDTHGVAPAGTYSYALSPDGADLYVTWNAKRPDAKAWDTVALSVVHIPAAERRTE